MTLRQTIQKKKITLSRCLFNIEASPLQLTYLCWITWQNCLQQHSNGIHPPGAPWFGWSCDSVVSLRDSGLLLGLPEPCRADKCE